MSKALLSDEQGWKELLGERGEYVDQPFTLSLRMYYTMIDGCYNTTPPPSSSQLQQKVQPQSSKHLEVIIQAIGQHNNPGHIRRMASC